MPITEGGVNLMGIAADASGVVFAGEIDGQLDLGGGHVFTFEPPSDVGSQAYIAKLDGNGDPVYARWTDITYFQGLAVDGLGNAAISGEHLNAFFGRIEQYRPDGTFLREIAADQLIPLGTPTLTSTPVVADWAGNLYWTFRPSLQDFGSYFVKVLAPAAP
jgi:hypothetical protein